MKKVTISGVSRQLAIGALELILDLVPGATSVAWGDDKVVVVTDDVEVEALATLAVAYGEDEGLSIEEIEEILPPRPYVPSDAPHC
ncbi:MAG: hypothetical protein WCT29_00645 [Candidatus Paceibacterota bacterium]|jgi:hypothetical protein